MLEADRLSVEPAQIGALLVAVGAAGVGLTTTLTVPAALVHPPAVTVTLYVPAIPAVAEGRVGFCNVDVNALGPVHE
jgi:ABC-type taurine transport system ATPase subunit